MDVKGNGVNSIVKCLFAAPALLTSACTVVHIVGESGNVETHWYPGISYIRVTSSQRPLYLQSETLGLGVSNKSITLGYGVFQQVLVEQGDGKSCLLVSIFDGPTKRDFSFQKKDPEYVCKQDANPSR